MPRWLCRRWGVALLVAAPLASCILDDRDRCSPGQVLDEGLCRCADGGDAVGRACVSTLLDASLDASQSVPEGGLGASCDAQHPCTDPAFPQCQQAPSGERYCTSTGCASASDCTGGFQCAKGGAGTYCRRPYTGQGVPCATSETCTGDARFCSSFLHLCLVEGCEPDSCDPGYRCFVASEFMPGVPNVCVEGGLLGS